MEIDFFWPLLYTALTRNLSSVLFYSCKSI